MIDHHARLRLLRKRVEALSFPGEVMERAAEAVQAAGMKLPGAAERLHKEWLNDLVATDDQAEFRLAASDPGAHFLGWVAVRAADRFGLSRRPVEAAARRLGGIHAQRCANVVWPQEIAWAQRLRLSENPVTATKAAMFLREAEGNPGKVFGALADIYGEALVMAGYSGNPAHDIAPRDIRFGDSLPEFTPLFLRYAARAYSESLAGIPRDRVEKLAERAAGDEERERRAVACEQAVAAALRFPMRRVLTVVSTARSLGVSPNGLFAAEEAFLRSLKAGEVDLDPGARSPQSAFVAAIADPARREALRDDGPEGPAEPAAVLWEVANAGRRWLDDLPESYRKPSLSARKHLEEWQSDLVSEKREAPHDPVSDFGFFLLEKAAG